MALAYSIIRQFKPKRYKKSVDSMRLGFNGSVIIIWPDGMADGPSSMG